MRNGRKTQDHLSRRHSSRTLADPTSLHALMMAHLKIYFCTRADHGVALQKHERALRPLVPCQWGTRRMLQHGWTDQCFKRQPGTLVLGSDQHDDWWCQHDHRREGQPPVRPRHARHIHLQHLGTTFDEVVTAPCGCDVCVESPLLSLCRRSYTSAVRLRCAGDRLY